MSAFFAGRFIPKRYYLWLNYIKTCFFSAFACFFGLSMLNY